MLSRASDLTQHSDGSGVPAPVPPAHAPGSNGNGSAAFLPVPDSVDSTRSQAHAAPAGVFRKRVRRSNGGPLLLYALFAALFVMPFASRRVVESPAGDLCAHLSGIVEAGKALSEGQFPVRVAPYQLGGIRYPILQFYGNFPYTLGALLTFIPGVDPYTAWRLITFACVTAAGFYTYRGGLALTRQVWPSVVAGLVFVASPYLTTDARARFAFPEAVSMCLLPAVFFYSWRSFASRRRALPSILAGAVCWSLVALSHNITILFASTLVGLFFLTCITFRPSKDFWRFARVGACYGLGVALAFWYVAPQLRTLKYIAIAQNAGSPMFSTLYVPLRVLLSPFLTIDPSATGTPNLGLQIGWPILAAAAMGVIFFAAGALGRRGFRWGMSARLLGAFLVAAFMVWSPVDFWRFLPSMYLNVQFTYRLLMLVVLWGSLLSAVVLAAAFARRGGMSARAGLACVVVVGLAAVPYAIWRHGKMDRGAVARIVASPDLGGQAAVAYRPLVEKMAAYQLTPAPGVAVIPSGETVKSAHYGRISTFAAAPGAPVVAQLPVLFYPDLLEVRRDRKPVAFGQINGLVALELPPGPHGIDVRFVGVRWANVVSGAAWVFVLVTGVVVAVRRGIGARAAAWIAAEQARRRPGPAAGVLRPFPARAAAFAFVLMSLPLMLPAAYTPLRKWNQRRSVGVVTASSESNNALRAEMAFDGDEGTAWAAAGGGPAVLTVVPPQARRVSGVRLEPRHTGLLEGWHKVAILLYLGGQKTGEQVFVLPDAPSQPTQSLKLDRPASADRIELHFADPVTVTPNGDRVFEPSAVNPGYREIRIESE